MSLQTGSEMNYQIFNNTMHLFVFGSNKKKIPQVAVYAIMKQQTLKM